MNDLELPIVDERNPRTFWQFLPILVVLLIAAAIRIVGAGHFPVSTDEGWTTWAISEPTFSAITEKLAADRHPPLYFLMTGYWSLFAGDSHLALRFPSILLGILTVAMIYRIGADTFGRTAQAGREDVSWYGMLMFALLPAAVTYSQEIRHYGLFVAAVTWSCLLFARILRTPRAHLLVMYTVSVALMLYTLYFAVWIIGLQVIVGLLMWQGDHRIEWRVSWRERGTLVLAWLAAGLAYLPWVLVILDQQWGILTGGIAGAPGTFRSTPADLLRLLELLLGGGLALTFGMYIVGLWGSLVSDRTDVTLGLRFANPDWLGELFIILWGLGLFIVLALVNSATGDGVLSARTTIFLSPALMIVVGAGIVRQRVGVRWSLLAGYIVVSVWLPPLIQPRLDYSAAAHTLAAHYSPADLIVLENGWDDNAFAYELRQVLGDDAQIIRTLPWVNNRDAALPVVPQIEDALNAAARVWVVNWLQPSQVEPHLRAQEGTWHEFSAYVGDEYRGRFADFGAADDVRLLLYVAPPQQALDLRFGEALVLEGVALAERATPSDVVYLDAWWQADAPLALDYSLGLYLRAADGSAVAELNGALSGDDTRGSSQWNARQAYAVRYRLVLPTDLPPATYTLAARVYHFATPEQPLRVNGAPEVSLGTLTVSDS